MKHLNQYITERYHQIEVFEGGASGHMLHPFDVDEFTCGDIEELIRSMFGGKIEGMTEKMDGFGMQASMNQQGEVVFIRNKGDLNSEKGGMTIDEFAGKWKENPKALENYTKGGKIIEAVFKKIGKDWFWPSLTEKRVVNCECIIEGTTNTIPYAADQVDFHNIWIYELNQEKGNEWVCKEVTKSGLDILEKACEGIDNAMITPNVIIKYTDDAQKLEKKWLDKWNMFLKEHKCSPEMTIKGIKFNLYFEYVTKHYPWILDDGKESQMLCDRWLFGIKSDWKNTQAIYKDHLSELLAIDKKSSKFVGDVLEPLQVFFYGLGADLIKITDGFINKGQDKTVKTLLADLKVATEKIKKEGSMDDNVFLQKWLDILKEIGEENLSSAEGIVFTYKGKMMKWTGGFVPLNKIIGYSKYSMSPKTLTESLFDKKLIQKNQSLPCGLEVKPFDWKLCQDYAEKRIKKYWGSMDIGDRDSLGDLTDDCALCYKSKDTAVFITKDFDDEDYDAYIYILCPETVYFHYMYSNQSDPVHLEDVTLANDFSIHFGVWIENGGRLLWGETQNDNAGRGVYVKQYMPVTIDDKAKKIIERIIKDKKYRDSFFDK